MCVWSRAVALAHYGSKAFKSTHWREKITHSLARLLPSAPFPCAPFRSLLHSTLLRSTTRHSTRRLVREWESGDVLTRPHVPKIVPSSCCSESRLNVSCILILTPCLWSVIASKRVDRFLCGWRQSLAFSKHYMIHVKKSKIDWEKAKLWGLEVIPIFLFPLWKHYDLNYIRKMANFCTMVSDLHTNEQMSEQSKQSKQGSEWCLAELMTMQAECCRGTEWANKWLFWTTLFSVSQIIVHSLTLAPS